MEQEPFLSAESLPVVDVATIKEIARKYEHFAETLRPADIPEKVSMVGYRQGTKRISVPEAKGETKPLQPIEILWLLKQMDLRGENRLESLRNTATAAVLASRSLLQLADIMAAEGKTQGTQPVSEFIRGVHEQLINGMHGTVSDETTNYPLLAAGRLVGLEPPAQFG